MLKNNSARKAPNEEYFSGNITADQYLQRVEKSTESDRKRRAIEERVNKLSERVRKYNF